MSLRVVPRDAGQVLRHGKLRFILLVTLLAGGAWGGAVAANPSFLTSANATSGSGEESTTGHRSMAASVNAAATSNSDDDHGANTSSSAHVSVTLNGQSVDVPDNGTWHKEMHSKDGDTSIDVDHDASAGDSSISIKMDSTSTVHAGVAESD